MATISLSVCRDVRHMPVPGHTSVADREAARLRKAVIEQPRFGRHCYYCDFAFGQSESFEVHNLDGDHTNTGPDNTAPICLLCHAPFHLDLVARRWRPDAGVMIYLPEVEQSRLNNLLQVVYFAKAEQQDVQTQDADTEVVSPLVHASSVLIELQRRADVVEKFQEGLSKPATLARVLTEMSDADYQRRDELLKGLRYLPPELRLIEEAKQWKMHGAAFAGLDVGAWLAIAGMNG
jgi:intracellular multiplication protein IcmJ